MAIRARMYVNKITQYAGSVGKEVCLQVVSANRGAENKEWAAATPSGNITMHVKNDDAVFKLGQDYLITFEEADPA
jgi:hypothetical protein